MTDTCDIAAYAAWQRRITRLLSAMIDCDGWLLPSGALDTRAPLLTREAVEEIQAARTAIVRRAGVDPESEEAWCASPDFAVSAVQQLIGCWAATPSNTKRFAAALADELMGQHREDITAAILELRRTRKTLPSVACVRVAIEAERIWCKGEGYEGEDDRDTGWRPCPGCGSKAWRAFPSVETVDCVLSYERQALRRFTGKGW